MNRDTKAVNSRIAIDRNARDKNVNANSASTKKALVPNKVVAANKANHKRLSSENERWEATPTAFFICRRGRPGPLALSS